MAVPARVKAGGHWPEWQMPSSTTTKSPTSSRGCHQVLHVHMLMQVSYVHADARKVCLPTCWMSSTARRMVQPVALQGSVSKHRPPHSACILSKAFSREYSCADQHSTCSCLKQPCLHVVPQTRVPSVQHVITCQPVTRRRLVNAFATVPCLHILTPPQ